MKITVCCYLKNATKVKHPQYYARIRIDGHTHDQPLHTTSKAVAESWVKLRRDEIRRYHDYVACGETVPPDLLSKLMPTIDQKGPSKAVPSLRVCLDSWEAELTRRGFSSRTVHMYCKSSEYMLKDLSRPVSVLTPELVRKQSTEHDHLRCTTRRSYFVAYKEFLKYCVKQYNISPAAVDEIPSIKQVRTDRPYWTMDEIRKIIDSVSCNSKEAEDCYKAYFWFLAVTGARNSEAAALTWTDLVDGIVTFRASTTKGNRERRVPVEWRVMNMLYRLPRHGNLVFSSIAKSQAGRYSVLARAVRKSGVHQGGLHTFRHSAAMYLYARCGIKSVSDMLGHSASTALSVYLASRTPDQLRDVVDKAYHDNLALPDAMDDLIKAGLV